MKKILHLTLKKEWFNEIVSGRKKEEYRDKKPYWDSRLNKDFDEVHFKNGYNDSVPFMRVEYLGLEIRDNTYVIKLGKILEVQNYDKIGVING